MGACGRLGRERSEARGLAHHTPESLLTGSVPQLEANLEAMDIDLLCNKEGAAGGCSVLWVELALGIALEETSLANARVTHDNDLAVDAVVNEGRISLHGEGRAAAQRKKKTRSGQAKLGEERSDGVDANDT